MRKYFCGIWILLLLIIVSLGGIQYYNNYSIVSLNRGLEVEGFKMLITADMVEDKLKQDFEFVYGFGCEGYENDALFLNFSGYPDVLDAYKLTGMTIKDPKFSVLNVQVGMHIDETSDYLEGFKINDESTDNRRVFKKGKVFITFQLRENYTIDVIDIGLKISNKENVVF